MILLLLTMCRPPNFNDLPEQGEQADHLLVLIHGAGDGPDDWPSEWREELPEHFVEPERWDIWTYDWSEDAKRRSSAAGRAYKHGISLGDQLSEDYDYAYVHLVGHSAGAFVVQGAIEQLIGPTVHATFLDPYGWKGLLATGWGRKHFGAEADFADNYFNSEDNVPSTDRAGAETFNIDLSPLAPDDLKAKEGHYFPLEWYRDSLEDPEAHFGFNLGAEVTGETTFPDDLTRGEVAEP